MMRCGDTMTDENKTIELRDAVNDMIKSGNPPQGFFMRFTFGEVEVAPETHPLKKDMEKWSDAFGIQLHRRIVFFKENALTQYECTWEGEGAALIETVENFNEAIQGVLKLHTLRPTFTFGFKADLTDAVTEEE